MSSAVSVFDDNGEPTRRGTRARTRRVVKQPTEEIGILKNVTNKSATQNTTLKMGELSDCLVNIEKPVTKNLESTPACKEEATGIRSEVSKSSLLRKSDQETRKTPAKMLRTLQKTSIRRLRASQEKSSADGKKSRGQGEENAESEPESDESEWSQSDAEEEDEEDFEEGDEVLEHLRQQLETCQVYSELQDEDFGNLRAALAKHTNPHYWDLAALTREEWVEHFEEAKAAEGTKEDQIKVLRGLWQKAQKRTASADNSACATLDALLNHRQRFDSDDEETEHRHVQRVRPPREFTASERRLAIRAVLQRWKEEVKKAKELAKQAEQRALEKAQQRARQKEEKELEKLRLKEEKDKEREAAKQKAQEEKEQQQALAKAQEREKKERDAEDSRQSAHKQKSQVAEGKQKEKDEKAKLKEAQKLAAQVAKEEKAKEKEASRAAAQAEKQRKQQEKLLEKQQVKQNQKKASRKDDVFSEQQIDQDEMTRLITSSLNNL